ncbi:MAG TPA: hypothetical protein VE954_32960 [Oligoflexus sp.]|uniref:hypothetical protein n=1 Tax=Oligoflexus sp. TaxID=1971216 RepID=UPI002D2C3B0C|nr:hypothetical protein [Oligoflexus sp.]HYX37937.1 hypothetical protein [Oligoflexus sp.]
MRALKSFFVMGFLSSILVSPAVLADVFDEGYNFGYDSAYNFCKSKEKELATVAEMEVDVDIIEEFQDGCFEGFKDGINYNRTCRKYIRETEGAATRMWQARAKACK